MNTGTRPIIKFIKTEYEGAVLNLPNVPLTAAWTATSAPASTHNNSHIISKKFINPSRFYHDSFSTELFVDHHVDSHFVNVVISFPLVKYPKYFAVFYSKVTIILSSLFAVATREAVIVRPLWRREERRLRSL